MRGGNVPEALASGKVVWSDPRTEVSQTANTCTNKQKLYMRNNQQDEYLAKLIYELFLRFKKMTLLEG